MRPGEQVRAAARRARARVLPGAAILLYHRVAIEDGDPSNLVVSPHHFEQHLDALTRVAAPVRTGELAETVAAGRRPRGHAAVTFDDGYVDNLLTALPALESRGLPATLFVVSGSIDEGGEFWWDELESLLLRPGGIAGPTEVRASGLTFSLAALPHRAGGLDRWNADRDPPVSSRHHAFLGLRSVLRDLVPERRQEVMADLRRRAPGSRAPSAAMRRCLTTDELKMLGASGLIEIGAHTVTHPFLPLMGEERQTAEITRCKSTIEDLIGRPVRGFSYPHGGYDGVSLRAVRSAGYSYACITGSGSVRRARSPLALPRFLVEDWDGDEFAVRLRAALGH